MPSNSFPRAGRLKFRSTAKRLVTRSGFSSRTMALPIALLLVFALSRVPGMLPQNFSAAYSLTFCAGVYFSGHMAWWLPLGTLLLTDIGLDVYYLRLGWPVFDLPILKYQLFNY